MNTGGMESIFSIPESYAERGLTKRELFAAMAMQGLLASRDTLHATTDQIADDAARLADALIAALNASPTP